MMSEAIETYDWGEVWDGNELFYCDEWHSCFQIERHKYFFFIQQKLLRVASADMLNKRC